MSSVQDPTQYYSKYMYNPTGKPREDNTYDDYVNYYSNSFFGSKQVKQMVEQGQVNNKIIKYNQTKAVKVIDPMWYDWQAINTNTLFALQILGVFLLLNVIGAKIGIALVCKNLK